MSLKKPMTKKQKQAVNALLNWSTMPGSTLMYVVAVLEFAEDSGLKVPERCKDEIQRLAAMMVILGDAFNYKDIE